MSYGVGRKLWPLGPNWAKGLSEAFQFGTDVMISVGTTHSMHTSWRVEPLRTISFEVLGYDQGRRIADNLLAGHSGPWELPLWQDFQWLFNAVEEDANEIMCRTEGFDFVVGGRAVLYSGPNFWKIVEIEEIREDRLVLTEEVGTAFGAGVKLIPTRSAMLQSPPEEVMFTDTASTRRVSFLIEDANPWPALEDLTMYREYPVLERIPNEVEDPTNKYERMLQGVDYDTTTPFTYDLANQAIKSQKTGWLLHGRESHTWFRSLIYMLDGKRVPMWVPSFNSDLQLIADVLADSPTIEVEWCGYTQFGFGRHNRQDVRIQLSNGTVLYRRIVDASESGNSEFLELDESISSDIVLWEDVVKVSIMMLATLAHDEVEIEHDTSQDGNGEATLGWRGVGPDRAAEEGGA